MKFCLKNLLNKDLKIVERKKLFFIIPLGILLLAIIAGVIFGVVKGNPFNVSREYTGGYTVAIRTDVVNDSNYDDYTNRLEKIVRDYRYEYNAKKYPVKFEGISKTCINDETVINIDYMADKGLPKNRLDKIMEELNEDFIATLNDKVGVWAPNSVSISGNTATVVYDFPVKNLMDDGSLREMLGEGDISVSNLAFVIADQDNPVYKTIKFDFSGSFDGKTDAEILAVVTEAATVDMYFSANASLGEMVGSTVKMDIIYYSMLAVLLVLVLLFIYLFFRFDLATSVAATITLLFDMTATLCLMVIFHIQLNSNLMAVLCLICALSAKNIVIIFNRIRENRNEMFTAGTATNATQIANKSIRESLLRNLYTSIALVAILGLISIVCAIGGINQIVFFALPLILGVIVSLYSSAAIAPALWTMLRRNNAGTPRRRIGGAKSSKASEIDTKNN